LVSKKDGTTRFCIDYRDFNSKLQFLDYPLPLTAEAIDRLSAGKGDPDSFFLCTLDLASGFWCMPVKEERTRKKQPSSPTKGSTCSTTYPLECSRGRPT
jgi:hypothetical protein